MDFLLAQRLASRAHKNVSYDPHRDRAAGFQRERRTRRTAAGRAGRLRPRRDRLAGRRLLPRYAAVVAARPGQLPPHRGGNAQGSPQGAERPAARRCLPDAGRPTAGASCAASPTSTRPSRASGSRRTRSPGCWSATARRPGCRDGTASTGCGACRTACCAGCSAPAGRRARLRRLHAAPARPPQGRTRTSRAGRAAVLEVPARQRLAGDHRHVQPRRAARPVRAGAFVLRRAASLALPDESPAALLAKAARARCSPAGGVTAATRPKT